MTGSQSEISTVPQMQKPAVVRRRRSPRFTATGSALLFTIRRTIRDRGTGIRLRGFVPS